MRKPSLLLISILLFVLPAIPQKSSQKTKSTIGSAASTDGDVLMDVIQSELARATTELAKADNPPYFISYAVHDSQEKVIAASNGAILTSIDVHRRTADVSVRVGTPAFDNTHDRGRFSGLSTGVLPLTNDRDAIARELWRLTDREYKQAAQIYLRLKTEQAVRAKEEDDSPDFSKETFQAQAPARQVAHLDVDQKAWEERIRRLSAEFNKYPLVYRSGVFLTASFDQDRFISSEKNRVVTTTPNVRLMVFAQTTAEDGMDLLRVETFQAADSEHLPAEAELQLRITKTAKDLIALRGATLAEPFNGPALLPGR